MGQWVGVCRGRITLTHTAIDDSHLSSMYLCVFACMCVCAIVHTLAITMSFFSLVGVGVQVAVYCHIAPTVCNSTRHVGALQTMLIIKAHS